MQHSHPQPTYTAPKINRKPIINTPQTSTQQYIKQCTEQNELFKKQQAAQQKKWADDRMRAEQERKKREDQEKQRRENDKRHLESLKARERQQTRNNGSPSSTGMFRAPDRGCPASHPIGMTFANGSRCVSPHPVSLSFGKNK